MTAVLIALVAVMAVALVALSSVLFTERVRRPARRNVTRARRILFPFVANALSARTLDAALRLANAEDATLVPIFLARVPLHLPLDAPLPHQSGIALPLQEAIEQRCAAFGVPAAAANSTRPRSKRRVPYARVRMSPSRSGSDGSEAAADSASARTIATG